MKIAAILFLLLSFVNAQKALCSYTFRIIPENELNCDSLCNRLIYGQVNDSEGFPASEIKVSAILSKQKTITDIDGKYSIETCENDTLLFSADYIKTKKIVADKIECNIILDGHEINAFIPPPKPISEITEAVSIITPKELGNINNQEDINTLNTQFLKEIQFEFYNPQFEELVVKKGNEHFLMSANQSRSEVVLTFEKINIEDYNRYRSRENNIYSYQIQPINYQKIKNKRLLRSDCDKILESKCDNYYISTFLNPFLIVDYRVDVDKDRNLKRIINSQNLSRYSVLQLDNASFIIYKKGVILNLKNQYRLYPFTHSNLDVEQKNK